MKLLIIAACVACALAAPLEDTAKVIRSDYNQSPEGDFQYAFETDNGIAAQVSGNLKQFAKDEVAVVQAGSNHYTAPDGQSISLTFTADENGYQPQGAHLPTVPPTEALPEHVVKTLAYIAAHPYDPKRI